MSNHILQNRLWLPSKCLLCQGLVLCLAITGTFSNWTLPTVEAAAGIYAPMAYQGKINTSAGPAIANGSYNMRFSIYDALTGGTQLWSETRDGGNTVTMTGGLFSVYLGEVTALSGIDFNDDSLFLNIEFDPGNDDTYEETFVPRRRFSAVPYAHNADTVDGLHGTQFLRSDADDTATGSITFSNAGVGISVQGTASGNIVQASSALRSSGSLTVVGTTQLRNYTSCSLITTDSNGNLGCSTSDVITQSDGDSRYVEVGGDTMTGGLLIQNGGTPGTIETGLLLEIAGAMSGGTIHAQNVITSSGTLIVEGATTLNGAVTLGSTLAVGGVTYTFPSNDGSATGKVLKTDGSGQLSWSDDNNSGGIGYSEAASWFVNDGGDTMTGGLLIQNGGTPGTIDTGLLFEVIGVMSGRVIHAQDSLTTSGSFAFDGNAVFGDNSTDTVTSNAGTWNFPNSTNFVLTNASTLFQFKSNAVIDGDQRVVGEFADLTASAAGVGAGFTLSGKYNAAGDQAGFAGIKGIKNNGTSGDYAGALVFITRQNGGAMTEQMRIDPYGNLGIGDSTPQTKLDVAGGISGVTLKITGASALDGAVTLGSTLAVGGVTYTFPSNDGSATGKVLKTDGAGQLSWSSDIDTDNDTTYGAGQGLTLTSTTFSVNGTLTGSLLDFDTYSGTTVHVQDLLTSSGRLIVENTTTNIGVDIQQTANGTGVNIISSATTAPALNVVGNSITNKPLARFYSNSANTTARNVVEIINDNTGSTSATALYIQQDGGDPNGNAVRVVNNGNSIGFDIQVENITTAAGLRITTDNTMTTGRALLIMGGASAEDRVFQVDEDGRTVIGAASTDMEVQLEVMGTTSGVILHAQDLLTTSGALIVEGATTLNGAVTLGSTLAVGGVTYTFPSSDGTATGKILATDGAGNLTWTTDQTSAGGGGGSPLIQEGDVTIVTTGSTLDFAAVDFVITESPANEANISLDVDGLYQKLTDFFVNDTGDTMTGVLVINDASGAEAALEVQGIASGRILHAQDLLTTSGALIVEGATTLNGAVTLGSTLAVGGVTYTFPSNDGSATGKVLKTDGAGNLSWSADIDTDNDTTYGAGQGLTLTSTTFSVNGTLTGTLLDFDTFSGTTVHAQDLLTTSGALIVEGATTLNGAVTLGSTLAVGGVTYTFPAADGSATGKVLKTDGSGQLSWSADIDTDNDTTYLAGQGLTLTSTTFSVNGTLTGTLLDFDTFSGTTVHAQDLLTTSGALIVEGTGLFHGNLATTGTLSGANLTVMAGADSYLLGEVGIGTTSAAEILHIRPDTGGNVSIQPKTAASTSTTQMSFMFEHQNGVLLSYLSQGYDTDATNFNAYPDLSLVNRQTSGHIRIATSDTERMRIDNTGNVGIGDTTPSTKLDVAGGISGVTLKITDASALDGAVTLGSTLAVGGVTYTFPSNDGSATGKVLKTDGSGQLSWSSDIDTDNDTTYGAGQGLTLTSTTFSVNGTLTGTLLDFDTFSGTTVHVQDLLTVSGATIVEGATTLNGAVTLGSTLAVGGVTYTFPSNDGSATGKVLKTDGAGQLSWSDDASGGASFAEMASWFVDDAGDTMTGALTINSAGGYSADVLLEVLGVMSGRSLYVNGTGSTPILLTDMSSGEVGIGLNANEILRQLHVKTTGNNGIRIETTASQAIFELMNSSEIWQIYNDGTDSNKLVFRDDTAKNMVITTDGEVGIGTTSPTTILEAIGTISGTALHAADLITSSGGLVIEGAATFNSTVAINGVTYTFPYSDGTATGKVLKTDGSGQLSWSSDIDTDNDTTYLAGQGLTLAGTVFSVNGTLTGTLLDFDTYSGTTVHVQDLLTVSGATIVEGTGLFHGNLSTTGTLSGANLTVMSGGYSYFLGKVGFGTTTPVAEVEVDGDLVVANNGSLLVGHTGLQILGGFTPQTQLLGTAGGDASMGIIRYSADANGPSVLLGKSRAGSIGSNTIVVDGDNLGDIRWQANDGTNFHGESASIRAETDGTPGTNDIPGRLIFATTADGEEAVTDRMIILNSGNVGIGTATPDTALAVIGTISGTILHARDLITSSGALIVEGATTLNGAVTLGSTLAVGGVTYTFPSNDGSATGKVLKTDGAGQLSWSDDASGGASFAEMASWFVDDAGDTMTGGLLIQNGGTPGTIDAGLLLEVIGTMSGRIVHAQDTLTSSGGLRVDVNTLVVDATNNRVGIGTNAPTYELDVVGSIGVNDNIYHNDDADTYITFSADAMELLAGGRRFIRLGEGADPDLLTINVANSDIDFIVESQAHADLIYADASTDRLGIGTNSPGSKLSVSGAVIIGGNISSSAAETKLEVVGTVSGMVLHAQDLITSSGGLIVEGATTLNGAVTLGSTLAVGGVTYTFPSNDGSATGKVLKTDGAGQLSWSDDSGSIVAGQGITLNGSVISLSAAHSGSTIEATTLLSGAAVHAQDLLTSSGGLIVEGTGLFHGNLSTTGTLSGANLTVMSGGYSYLLGKVGIGTTDPTYDLDVAGEIGVDQYIRHNGDHDTYIEYNADRILIQAGGAEYLDFFNSLTDTMTINGGGSDMDLIVQSSNDNTLLFTNGGTDRVGISTNNPETLLEVIGTVSGAALHAQDLITSSGGLIVEGTGLFHGNLATTGTLSGANLTVMSGATNYLLGETVIGGTTSHAPYALLSVTGGNGYIQNTSGGANITVDRTDGKIGTLVAGGNAVSFRVDASGEFNIQSQSRANLELQNGTGLTNVVTVDGGASVDSFVIDSASEVGIGTATPTEKLEVIGTVSGMVLHAQDLITSSGGLIVEGAATFNSTVAINGVTYTFPSNDGSATGKVLKTDGAGQLSWSDDAGAAGGLGFAEAASYFVDDGGDTMTGGLLIQNGGTPGTIDAGLLLEVIGTMSGRIVHAQDTLTSSGGLRVDVNTLVVDATNNRVGIGTNAPADELDVSGSIRITGTANTLAFAGAGGGANEGITYKDSGAAQRYGLLFPGSDIVSLANRASNGVVQIRANTSTAGSGGETTVAEFQDNAIHLLTAGGSVGIGTITPETTLEVIGTISGAALHAADLITSSGGLIVEGTGLFHGNLATTGTLSGANLTVMAGADSYLLGNVGIGTTTPGEFVTLKKNTLRLIELDRTDNAWVDDTFVVGVSALSGTSNDFMYIGNTTGTSDGMVIRGDGLVGIGTNAPETKLEVAGTISGAALHVYAVNNDLTPSANVTYNLGSDTLRWKDLFLSGGSLHMGASGDEGIIGFDTSFNRFTFDADGNGTSEFNIESDGSVALNGLTYDFPASDGSATGKVLKTDGAGKLSWSDDDTGAGGGISYTEGSSWFVDESGDTMTGGLLIQNGGTAGTIEANVLLEVLGTMSGRTVHAKDSLTSSGTLRVEGKVIFNDVAYTFPTNNGNANQCLATDGNGTLTWQLCGGGLDFAEYFYISDDVVQGELVCIDTANNETLVRCTNDADTNLMGIVSSEEQAAFIGNQWWLPGPKPDGWEPVGIVGQLQTLVTTENGNIAPGDGITSSALIPGHGRKASPGESNVGIALEAVNGTGGVINVLVARRNALQLPEGMVSQVGQGLIQSGSLITLSSTLTGASISFESISGTTVHAQELLTVSGSLVIDEAGSLRGAGLADCDGANQALQWDATTGQFSCTTITGGVDYDQIAGSFVSKGGGTMTGNLTIQSGGTLTVDGAVTFGSTVTIGGVTYTFPTSDGSTSGKTLKTDGNGNLSWSDDIDNDTTYQAGQGLELIGEVFTLGSNLSGTTIHAQELFTISGSLVIDEAGSIFGAGLSDCDGTNQALQWNEDTGRFSCTTITAGIEYEAFASSFVNRGGGTMTGGLLIQAGGVANVIEAGLLLEVAGAMSGRTIHAQDSLTTSGSLTVANSTTFNGVTYNWTDTGGSDDQCLRTDGSGTLVWEDCTAGGGADFAEYFYSADDLEQGELVCIDINNDNTLRRCDRSADANLMGIVSSEEQASLLGNQWWLAEGIPKPEGWYPVGIVGQLKTKVTNENGPIRTGDAITSSALQPGYGRRASGGESNVGIALESYDGVDGYINVLVARRNASLTVQAVEDEVMSSIAAMEIEDEVSLLVTDAIESLDVADISDELADELNLAALETQLDLLWAAYEQSGNQVWSGALAATQGLIDGELEVLGTTTLEGLLNAQAGISATNLTVAQTFTVSGSALFLDGVSMSEAVILGNATVEGDLTVNGTLHAAAIEATSLTLNGVPLDLSTLQVSSGTALDIMDLTDNALAIRGEITVEGIAYFGSDVVVAGELVVSDRLAGYVVIPKSGKSVTMEFDPPFENTPLITASADAFTLWRIINQSATGFTIEIPQPAVEDVTFTWHALANIEPATVTGEVDPNAPEFIEFSVDRYGYPVSSSEVWNACIRNQQPLDETGLPFKCSRYHDGHIWEHFDTKVSFTFDPEANDRLILPEGYQATVVDYEPVQKEEPVEVLDPVFDSEGAQTRGEGSDPEREPIEDPVEETVEEPTEDPIDEEPTEEEPAEEKDPIDEGSGNEESVTEGSEEKSTEELVETDGSSVSEGDPVEEINENPEVEPIVSEEEPIVEEPTEEPSEEEDTE